MGDYLPLELVQLAAATGMHDEGDLIRGRDAFKRNAHLRRATKQLADKFGKLRIAERVIRERQLIFVLPLS